MPFIIVLSWVLSPSWRCRQWPQTKELRSKLSTETGTCYGRSPGAPHLRVALPYPLPPNLSTVLVYRFGFLLWRSQIYDNTYTCMCMHAHVHAHTQTLTHTFWSRHCFSIRYSSPSLGSRLYPESRYIWWAQHPVLAYSSSGGWIMIFILPGSAMAG